LRTVGDAGPYNELSEVRMQNRVAGCGSALPLPMGEVARRQARRRGLTSTCKLRYTFVFSLPLPSQSKIEDFCQLPRWGSQAGCGGEIGCGPSGTPVPTMFFRGAVERTVGDAGPYSVFSGVRWSGPSGTPVPTMFFRGCGGADRRGRRSLQCFFVGAGEFIVCNS